MAKITEGPELFLRGRIGNRLYYISNGVLICRSIGVKPNQKPSEKELTARQATSMSAEFHNANADFLRVGYNLEGFAEGSNYHNEYRKAFQTALVGDYADRSINYHKLLVTHGEMPVVQDSAVQPHEQGFEFSWNPASQMRGMHYTDHVMLLAYFPAINKSCYMTTGRQRHTGRDVLEVLGVPHGQVAEIFISFIEDNHRSISDSTYLGRGSW